jgi:hypothetical protein
MFDTLFDWASHGHEKTLNQRVRPGLIIILNKSTEQVHGALDDVEETTRQMLRAFESLTRFAELRRKWEARGHTIRKAEDLIHCYYLSFRVISIPAYSSRPAMATQVADMIQQLYKEIRQMSRIVRTKRKSYNMDLDVAGFNAYVKNAAQTLARDLKSVVDFHQMQMCSGDSRLPGRFSEHLVQLMSNMLKERRLDEADETGGEARLVRDLIPFIACCIVAQIPKNEPGESIS